MTATTRRQLDLDTLTLQAGKHQSIDDGVCIMEAVSYVAGEPWSDHPQCASPVIGAFMRRWNDTVDDDGRQALKPYILRLVGTRGTPAEEDRRGWMAADWLVHTSLPLWLRAAGLEEQAVAVDALPEVTSRAVWLDCRETISEVRKVTWPARAELRGKVREAVLAELAKQPKLTAAAAVAVAAAGLSWYDTYDVVYEAVKAKLAGRYQEVTGSMAAAQQSALDLLDRMIAVTEAAW